jgi:hypothetical protein
VWVLGTLAKRWTAALQPEGFDSPALLAPVQPKNRTRSQALALGILTPPSSQDSLKMLGKRAQV